MEKVLYCIRHGTALHNILFWDQGEIVYEKYLDTPLVKKGVVESLKFGEEWNDIHKIELVIVSPLLRTLQTADNIFCKKDVPMIALDCLMEYPQGIELCNRRKTITEYKPCFPDVDFAHIESDEETQWRSERKENLDELQQRIDTMIEFIRTRKEKHIAIVSHSSYLGYYLHKKIGDENNELKHCYPYIHKL